MSNEMPFKPLLAFQDAGCTHVLCGNGAHFVWEHGGWRELPPMPQSAREADYEMQQARLQPIETHVLAELDRATAAGVGMPSATLASRVAERVGRPILLVQLEISRLVKAGVLLEETTYATGKRRSGVRVGLSVIKRATPPEVNDA